MTFTLKVSELLDYHRKKYKNDGHEHIRNYILENETIVYKRILLDKSVDQERVIESDQTKEQEDFNCGNSPVSNSPNDPVESGVYLENSANDSVVEEVDERYGNGEGSGLDLGAIELDTETLDEWQKNQTAIIDNEQFNQYLQLQQRHREKFLKEIKQKGFSLKNEQNENQNQDQAESKVKRISMNY